MSKLKTAGYSGTPLLKKLGIKAEMRLRFVFPPDNYQELLGELPENVTVTESEAEEVDFIHLFAKDQATFEQEIAKLKDQIQKHGMIWVSWYKKASKIPTDLNENIIRDTALSLGLVDIKVCAVDEKWSGLKLVWRKENR
jgi:hypothetical protein